MSWAAVAAAAIGVGGSYLVGKNSGKPNAQQKQLEQQQIDASKFLLPFGQRTVQQGADALQLPIGFYSSIAKGNRASALQTLAPELSAYDESDRSSMGAASELAPRGGGSADFLSRMPFRRNQNTQNLLFGARTGAMNAFAETGTNLMGIGMNAIGGGTSGNMGLLNFGLNQNNQAFQQGSQAGASIYQIIKSLTDAYNAKKTTTPTNTNPFEAGTGNSGTGNPAVFGGGPW